MGATGLEGGLEEDKEGKLQCFAWMVVLAATGDKIGSARTATFELPEKVIWARPSQSVTPCAACSPVLLAGGERERESARARERERERVYQERLSITEGLD